MKYIGVARLRRAIENQATVGEMSFSMTFDEAGALLCECEDELARLAWAKGVPAPRDVDGEVVPLTTKVLYDIDGREHKANFYSFAPESDYWTVNIDEQSDSAAHVTEGSHLTRPDSWERIADELDEQAGSLTKDGYTWQEDAIHDFADRIRELAKREGTR